MKTENQKLNEIKEQIKEALYEQRASTLEQKERERFLSEDSRDKPEPRLSPRRRRPEEAVLTEKAITTTTTNTTTPSVETLSEVREERTLPVTSVTTIRQESSPRRTHVPHTEARPVSLRNTGERREEIKRLQTFLSELRTERERASLEVSQSRSRGLVGPASTTTTTTLPSSTRIEATTTTIPSSTRIEEQPTSTATTISTSSTRTHRTDEPIKGEQTEDSLRSHILQLEVQLSNEKQNAVEKEREVRSLRENLRTMSKQLETLRTELVSLQGDTTSTREAHSTLMQQITELEDTVQQLRNQNSEQIMLREAKIRELEQRLEESEKKNQELQSESSRLSLEKQNQINSLLEQLRQTTPLATQTKKANNEVYIKQVELEELKSKLKEMQKERESRQNEGKQRTQKMQEFEGMLNEKEREIEAMKLEILHAKDSRSVALENQEREIAKRQNQLVADYRAKISELEAQIQHERSVEEEKNNEITKLMKHIEDMDNEVYETYKELEREKNEEIAKKNQEIQSLQGTLTKLQEELTSLRNSPSKVAEAELQLEKVRRQTNQQLTSQQKQINELLSQLQRLENEKTQFELQKAQAERRVLEVEKEKRKQNNEVRFKQLELEELKGKLNELHTEKESRHKESKQKSEKVKEYERMLEEKEKELESMKLAILHTQGAKNAAIENKERELKQLAGKEIETQSEIPETQDNLGLMVDELKSKILELELTLSQEKGLEEAKDAEIRNLDQQIQNMHNEVQQTYKELERQKLNELHFKDVEIEELQSKIQQMQKENSALLKEIKLNEELNNETLEQLQEKESEIESLKVELLHKEGSKIVSLENKEREIAQTIQTHKAQKETELNQTRALNETEKAEYEAIIHSLHAQIEELQEEGKKLLSTKDSQIVQLTHQLRTQKMQAEAEENQLEKKIKDSEEELHEKLSKVPDIDRIQLQLKEMQGDRERYQKEITQRGEKIIEYERLLEEKQKEIESMKLNIRQKEGEKFAAIEHKEREVVRTGQQKEEKTLELNKALSREEDYTRVLEQYKERMRLLEEENERHNKERETLTATYQAEIQRLSQRVITLQEQSERNQQVIGQVEQQEKNANIAEKIAMEAEMQRMVQRVREKESQVEEKNKQLDQLSSDLQTTQQQQQLGQELKKGSLSGASEESSSFLQEHVFRPLCERAWTSPIPTQAEDTHHHHHSLPTMVPEVRRKDMTVTPITPESTSTSSNSSSSSSETKEEVFTATEEVSMCQTPYFVFHLVQVLLDSKPELIRDNSPLLFQVVRSIDLLQEDCSESTSFFLLTCVTRLLHELRLHNLIAGQMDDPIKIGVITQHQMMVDSDLIGLSRGFEVNLHVLALKIYKSILFHFFSKIDPLIVPSFTEVEPIMDTRERQGHNTQNQNAMNKLISQLVHFLELCKQNRFFPSIIYQSFSQIYMHINEVIFEHLMSCSSLSGNDGMQLKAALAELEGWATLSSSSFCKSFDKPTLKEYFHFKEGLVFNLSHISQQLSQVHEVANFLLSDKSSLLSFNLPANVISHISSVFVPDLFAPRPISASAEVELNDKLQQLKSTSGTDGVPTPQRLSCLLPLPSFFLTVAENESRPKPLTQTNNSNTLGV